MADGESQAVEAMGRGDAADGESQVVAAMCRGDDEGMRRRAGGGHEKEKWRRLQEVPRSGGGD